MPVTRPFTATASAAALSVVAGVGFIGLAGLSLGAGHGTFSWQIASLLGMYGLALVIVGALSWRAVPLAAGAVISLALLNLVVAAQYLATVGGWLLAGCALATVVAGIIGRVAEARRAAEG